MPLKNPLPVRECLFCKKQFVPQRTTSKHCDVKCRQAQYRETHREEARERTRKWYADNPRVYHKKTPVFAACKHCGKQFHKRTGGLFCTRSCRQKHRRLTKPEWYKNAYVRYKEHSNRRNLERYYRVKAERPFQPSVEMAKVRARAAKVPFDLTLEWGDARWTGCCELTKLPFELGHKRRGAFSPSIDRIDPIKGYTQENSRFVLWAVNMFKGDWPTETILEIAKALIKHNP